MLTMTLFSTTTKVDLSGDEPWKRAEKIRIVTLFESLQGTLTVVPSAMLAGGKGKEKEKGKKKKVPVLTAVAVA